MEQAVPRDLSCDVPVQGAPASSAFRLQTCTLDPPVRILVIDDEQSFVSGLAQILREIGQKKPALKAFKQLLDVHPYWSGAQDAVDELERDVEGQGI